ncbi:hypothetical protein OGAPHI_006427 [Ogataea philodendri]|uniref:Uncharacterized protein n=1 Tax=Ogataea philodendri TaxID=1378263 RepID=A0A9P8T0W3_9ASCO|nr:uncharacterized protein OGAPHI_006427 [Ogataea philodendri]KAH3661579.1 hypothetical protein OGAPHI_006427 [Ogataea philodendri]
MPISSEVCIRKRPPVQDRKENHFETKQSILDLHSAQETRRVLIKIGFENSKPTENTEQKPLPVGSKYDQFDAKEFAPRIKLS